MKPMDFERGAKNLVCVCVDEKTSSTFSGRVYHRFSVQPELFCEPNYMLKQMDALFDQLHYPQRALTEHVFSLGRRTQPSRKEKETMPKEELRVIKEPTEEKGTLATFVVHVMYRQNATWQGSVLWAESGQTQHFRSALELVRLMDSALENKEQNKDEHNAT